MSGQALPKRLRVGSRASALAVVQSQMVIDRLRAAYPQTDFELVTMTTLGDRILDRPLEEVGGKGLFLKELDEAMLSGKIDLAVHSLKDMPAELADGLEIAAFSAREDPGDCMVWPKGMQGLPLAAVAGAAGAVPGAAPIGCSGFRRRLFMAELYPDVPVAGIRGNVQTRLRKLDEGQYSALVLAVAGLKRLGLAERIGRRFNADELIPAAGQGILAVCVRTAKGGGADAAIAEMVRHAIDDAAGRACARAERAFIAAVGGGCNLPATAFAQIEDGQLLLRGLYSDGAGLRYVRGTAKGLPEQGGTVAKALALQLKQQFDQGEGVRDASSAAAQEGR